MNFEISSALLHFLVAELKILEEGKVEKIYQVGKETIIFRIYKEGKKHNLRITLPGVICLTKQEFVAPMLPPGFCMFLRKRLTNTRIEKVEQKDFERILLITFKTKTEEYLLIVELFKPGNIILCKEDLIINSLNRQRFKDREIQAKKMYKFPPSLKNPLTTKEDELIQMIKDSDRNLVKTMASKLGLGGIYSEELLERANIDKDKKEINKEEAKQIKETIKEFFEEKINPIISEENVYPINMKTKKGEPADNISEAIDSKMPLEKKEEKTKTTEKKKEKTGSLVDIQEKMIKNLEKKIIENQEKAEFIYSNYQNFNELIKTSNKIRKEKGLDVLEEEMKTNPKFKSLNKKDKEIMLKF